MSSARSRSMPAIILPVLVFLLVSVFPCRALQGADGGFPFQLRWGTELAIGATDLGLFGLSLYLQTKKPEPNLADVDPNSIPFFDRAYATKTSSAQVLAADVLLVAVAAVPGVALPGLSPGEVLAVGAMYAETLGLAYASSSFLKSVVVRYRPYAYASPPPSDFSNADTVSSFPSRHATLAFASAVFVGYLYEELHPDSRYKGLVWATGLGIAGLVSVLRVTSADHFLSDVVGGAVLGAAEGFLVPFLHRKKPVGEPEPAVTASLEPLPGGLLLSLRY
jgi:membrane-associated phospholipid phosphatase